MRCGDPSTIREDEARRKLTDLEGEQVWTLKPVMRDVRGGSEARGDSGETARQPFRRRAGINTIASELKVQLALPEELGARGRAELRESRNERVDPAYADRRFEFARAKNKGALGKQAGGQADRVQNGGSQLSIQHSSSHRRTG